MAQNQDCRLFVASILPPGFVLTIVGVIWYTYMRMHLLPMLQTSSVNDPVAVTLYSKGVWQTCVSQALTAMFAICFALSLSSHPGSVSDDPEWLPGSKVKSSSELTLRELKSSTGDRRFCKWCQRYKPDRCHHCRICKSCVLKMDHHCPWIMNCVGFRNHKYFFLLVCYAVANCLFITLTMSESVQRSMQEEVTPNDRFLLVLGLVLAVIMCSLMGCFLAFHTWLMFKGMTTIEFCEKNLSSSSMAAGSQCVSYDLGGLMNVKAVLGPNPLLWFFPVSLPVGNGVSFETVTSCPDSEPEWTGKEAGATQA